MPLNNTINKTLFFNKMRFPAPALIFLAVTSFCLSACNFFSGKDAETKILAKVGEKILTAEHIKGIIPEDASEEDSIRIVQDYVNAWARKQLVVKKAEENLPEYMKDFQKQIDDYRNSLLVYQYEKEMVRQRLNTDISDAEIEDYYEKNKDNFRLKDNIINCLYVKVPKDAPNRNKVKTWLTSDKENDKEQLRDYCMMHATNFFLEENTWLFFDDILKEIPLKTYDQESFLKYNRFVEAWDSTHIYMVNILGFRIKESISPLIMEQEKIYTILLNKRKLSIIRQLEEDIYKEGLNRNYIELFI